MDVIYNLAEKLGLFLQGKNSYIVTAESCTGGLLAASITAVPGSSAYFERGFVVYNNIAKQEDLGVRIDTLEKYGAVSEQVAKEMVLGGLERSRAQISVAITGLAGPTGATKDKPVGMVCLALASRSTLLPTATTMYFSGDRKSIRQQAVIAALESLLKYLGVDVDYSR